ncbi:MULTISPECIES: hypothetical protein [Paenarthrobacter]|uniref:hypothetical protein n=1 Tax=Paenarthrobacter TaxID=1742992 RepID=UPI0018783928|nr:MULTISPECIES: hypothetical protein [Paenarthrobacter]QOT18051.1 hypothetical protein HMI59_16550 [Paenarthrobacter sp. YJN-5]QQQ63117.1 hypothetical protein JHQ56_04610 [Paenarthrobacter ureafaciens]UOD82191.1 hypothetical protein MQZ73_04780 [Paenarthrobacter ureafaciens]WNZ05688.1 hypothetical protein PVT25_09330 [Paenarthrobacter ureafaciens]
MTAVLPWATLVICLAITVARIPSALRGENRVLFYLFALITMDIFLSIEAPYLAIDAVLGGMNVTNLILRFLLYGTFLLLGTKVAAGFDSKSAGRAIHGPWGLAVLGVIAALTTFFFVITDTRGSSVGMNGLTWGPSMEAYAALGRFYPGYVAACLLPAIWRTITGRFPALLRGASALLMLGLTLLLVSQLFPLIPAVHLWLRSVINYSAVLATSVGLAGIWFSKAYAKRKARRTT